MVHEIKDRNLFTKLKGFSSTPFFIPVLFLLFLVITIPVITLVSSRPVDIRQRATSLRQTATINIQPGTGTVAPNTQFTADLVINASERFNAAQAEVVVSGNVVVNSITITPPEQGGCNFTFANESATPSVNNLSFAGAILNDSTASCKLYSINLQAGSEGSINIQIANPQVKAVNDNEEIFLSSQNGLFTISTGDVDPIAQSDIYLSPATSALAVQQDIAVQVRLNTNGQTVNAVEAQISYPQALLDVISIDDTNSDFNVPAEETFTNDTVNVAYGSITPKSGDILVTTVIFRAKAAGVATVDFASSAVISSVSNTDVLKSATGGVYAIDATPSVGPSPTPLPTNIPTPTTQPTTPPQPSPTPTTIVASPTLPPASVSLTVNTIPGATYREMYILSGNKSANATEVVINNSSSDISYPSSTLWQYQAQLIQGLNTFAIYAQDSDGVKSSTAIISISRNRVGDITGDNIIDLTDLSIFGSDWGKTSSLNNLLSDMNEDGSINLTDFSIFAKAYGN